MSPSTVDTSTRREATEYGYHHKSFYTEGLFWAFYTDGTNAGWNTSVDGVAWNAFTSIGASVDGNDFSVWFDGTYIHYARRQAVAYDLYYRRGTPVNDGTITWIAEQMVLDGTATNSFKYPSICVDTNGYAWIGVLFDKNDGDDLPTVVKNDNNNGTWSTDFTYELGAVDDTGWKTTVIPLTDGKVYAIWCRYNQPPRGKLYDAGWGAEESDLGDYNMTSAIQFCAVAEVDDVHFIYNRITANQFRYNLRTFGVGWGVSDVLVEDDAPFQGGISLAINTATNDLYAFWTDKTTDHVYYKKYSSGSWDVAPTDWIDESIDEIDNDTTSNSFYQAHNDYIGFLYTTELGSPYKVRFAFLDLSAGGNSSGAVVMGTDSLILDLLLEGVI